MANVSRPLHQDRKNPYSLNTVWGKSKAKFSEPTEEVPMLTLFDLRPVIRADLRSVVATGRRDTATLKKSKDANTPVHPLGPMDPWDPWPPGDGVLGTRAHIHDDYISMTTHSSFCQVGKDKPQSCCSHLRNCMPSESRCASSLSDIEYAHFVFLLLFMGIVFNEALKVLWRLKLT